MLTEEAIRRALHASRVMPLTVANPHGPLGLEHLAAAVAAHRNAGQAHPQSVGGAVRSGLISRPIEVSVQTWEKLHSLAAATSRPGTPPVSAGELAAAIIEQYVLDADSGGRT
jgi:hypothetical protein